MDTLSGPRYSLALRIVYETFGVCIRLAALFYTCHINFIFINATHPSSQAQNCVNSRRTLVVLKKEGIHI